MYKRQRIEQATLLLGDVGLIVLATVLTFILRFGDFSDILHSYTGSTFTTVVFYLLSFYIFEMYTSPGNGNKILYLKRSILSVVVAGGLAIMIFYFYPDWKYGRGLFFIQMSLIWLFCSLWRICYWSVLPKTEGRKKILIIGAGKAGHFYYDWLSEIRSQYEIIGFLDDNPKKTGKKIGNGKVLGTTDMLFDIGRETGVRDIRLAITHELRPRLIRKLLHAKLLGWNIMDMTNEYECNSGRVPVRHIHDEWLVYVEGFYLNKSKLIQNIKQIADIVLSSTLFVVLLPVLLLLSLMIKLDSEGPVIYRQKRLGKDGVPFTLYKFRSMKQDAETNGVMWTQNQDERITGVGKWIRITRLDEIPQLLNVLQGKMSIVGPRPERPEFVSELEEKIPYYFIRQSVKPGITGWAQINYPYGSTVDEALNKLEYDLYYIKNMSLFLDMRIILRTISVILFGKGAR